MTKKQAAEQTNDIIIIEEGKAQAAIHNTKAHALGLKWGKEVQKRNGADIKNLRAALDIIADIRDIADVVDAYKEAGGDNATASRIKKILSSAYADPACRAVVFDETSNSLQGCYKKIRDIEKGTDVINDGEQEVTEAVAAEDDYIEVPENIDISLIMEQIDEIIAVVGTFDTKGAKLLSKARMHIGSYGLVVEHEPVSRVNKFIEHHA